ncbi:MAG: hypothetical protein WKF94_13425 [Solirubrobacteraceae bacterium]
MKRLSYSNVMASVAVFIALGGSAFAATKIAKNSVTSASVKNGSLTDKDVNRSSQTRYVLLDEQGKIVEQSGGFKTISTPGTNDQPTSNPNIYVKTGTSLKGHGLAASIAIQNQVDTNTDGTPDPNFAGQASVGRCNTDTITCVPAGTNENDVLVYRAQVPAANPIEAGTPARAYIVVTP